MTDFNNNFLTALNQFDKERSVSICLDMLRQNTISIETLYLEILTPALNRLVFPEDQQNDMIWKEHLQSAIVRSIIESAFPYVLSEREKRNTISDKKVVVFCPEEEQHELGARMAADFFTIAGYKTTYLGARTPVNTLLKALESLEPDIVVISITNSFNLFAAKRTVEQIRNHIKNPMRIYAGGNACSDPDSACHQLGIDGVINDLRKILNDDMEEAK